PGNGARFWMNSSMRSRVMAERTFTQAMGRDEVTSRVAVDAPFGKALVELGRQRPEIVGLTADLGKYTDILPFRDAYPERFFNVGMAEQNLVAVAARRARAGAPPVLHNDRGL